MISLPNPPSVPGVLLALPDPQGRRAALRRRAALGVALLVVAGLAVLVSTGTIRLPGAAAAPKRQAPRAVASEAQLAHAPAQLRASKAPPASGRVIAPRHASALFAQHSWYVLPPAPMPPPPPPPPAPTAPPFPYTFVGSFAPEGKPPVFFLAQKDRVIDAHVGDRLDGVYQFESAAGGQLVFVYLPLNVRQNLAAGASR